ncbi:MAG: phosphodiesterase, family [Firmicutes bacterium]|nr:phosphodiesterase, family [Bacillota bacterium]
MMKIGIISDTHGCVETWRKVYENYFKDAALILHAGDVLYHGPRNLILPEYNPKALIEELNGCPVPMVTAAGNCDAEVDAMVLNQPILSPYAYVMIEGKRIVINHGHLLDEEAIWQTAGCMQAVLFITGHTHVASLKKQEGIIWLNPGSPVSGLSKREDKKGTFAIIEDNRVFVMEVNTGEIILSDVMG